MRIRVINYTRQPNLIKKLELRIENADDWQYLTKSSKDQPIPRLITKLLERVAGKDKENA